MGDAVFVKLQPYVQSSVPRRANHKLAFKYFGPFLILEKIGEVVYRLQLPASSKIHPVFHVSQLKKHLGSTAVPCSDLPLIGPDGKIRTEPALVLETRQIPRHNLPVVQWLVQWENLPPNDSTWDGTDFIKHTFPTQRDNVVVIVMCYILTYFEFVET